MIPETYHFIAAKPVWQKNEEYTMNHTVSFCAELDGARADAVLAAAASSSFVVLINGYMIAHGPQRCAHGFYRVDEIPLGAHLQPGRNIVAVRVAGYNCNSFSYLDQPSFFCGEIRSDGKVLAYTAEKRHDFRAYEVTERIQKVQRFSYQRTFAESYDLANGAFSYETGGAGTECAVRETQPKYFLKRTVPYGDYDVLTARPFQTGSVSDSEKDVYWKNRFLSDIGEDLKGFPESELTYSSHVAYQRMDCASPTALPAGTEPELAADTYIDFDFGCDYAGCFEFDVEGDCDTLLFAFDEMLTDGAVHALRFSTTAMVAWRHLHGSHHLISVEPYTLRYLRIIARGGSVRIRNLHMNKIAFPLSQIRVKLNSADPALQKIYRAALETFAANAVDIYMDCPSRERAGWLCDSFFTSRVEWTLTGKCEVERAFLENFLLPDSFRCLPRGVLPMCYPSDFYNGSFIPNWTMWYVLELQEYMTRTGDRMLVEQARVRLYELDRYLRGFENEFGLLENLQGWVFVEWSKANDFLQDVNFPSNMLYVGYKRAMASLYGDAKMNYEADRLTDIIRSMAMTPSGFFCDNAVRKNGRLELSGERTEACQYYAFFFRIATPKSHPDLWRILLNEFGPDRIRQNKYPEIYPANAFIGNYLRLDILNREGCGTQLIENIRGYFEAMADQTGTLWENMTPTASCNHGFASHVIYWLDQQGLLEHEARSADEK